MFELPQIMRDAQALARYAGAAQSQSARNMANADTPGFRGEELVRFSEVLDRSDRRNMPLLQTRLGHVSTAREPSFARMPTTDPIDMNGNNVSLETEMVRAASAQSQHTTAMTVYRASLEMMRTALGRGR